MRERQERQTARRRQSSLAGSRSRTSNSTSGGILSELAAARARMARVVGGERGRGGAITEAYGGRAINKVTRPRVRNRKWTSWSGVKLINKYL